ncbi:four helix bundle protein [Candidatus Saccharibacteria bacterium]|nr:MAG: four helix bundle protein [Candidatus Saccharibacteria bacterium]
MTNEVSKIRSFTDLTTWQQGHKLVLMTYQMVKKFPRDEDLGLKIQMKRAAVSVTSNIAEGFSRGSYREKRFYEMAKGSLTELQNQSLIARDVKYIDSAEFATYAEHSVTVLSYSLV